MNKYKKLELPEVITPIIEEMWCLTRNDKFISEVDGLRKKYGITPAQNLEIDEFIKKNTKIQNFERNLNSDIYILVSRTRISKSKHSFNLWHTIKPFIFTGELEVFDEDLPGAAPIVDINKLHKKIELKISFYYDTTEDEINKAIQQNWKDTRKAQMELAGDLLKSSPKFRENSAMWDRRYIDNETEEKIESDLIEGLSKDVIKLHLKLLNKRIKASFE